MEEGNTGWSKRTCEFRFVWASWSSWVRLATVLVTFLFELQCPDSGFRVWGVLCSFCE